MSVQGGLPTIEPSGQRQVKPLALVNCKSGSFELNQEYLRHVEDAEGLICELTECHDLPATLLEASHRQCTRIVVVGGDGTISRLVNQLAGRWSEFEWALVPSGTGNDFARSLGIPVDDLAAAWTLALEGMVRPIDLVQITCNGTESYFVNGVSGGFGGEIARDVDKDQKTSWGKLAYWLAALAKMGDLPEFDLAFVADGVTHRMTALGVWLANGRTIGGGFPVAPNALLNDGLIDVMVVPSLSTFDLLAAGMDFTLVGPEESDKILNLRVAELVGVSTPELPMSVDGEPISASNLECRVLPSSLQIVTGPVAPAVGSV